MATRIPELDPALDDGVKEVISAGGHKEDDKRLLSAVSSLFGSVPKLYRGIRDWTKSVQDSEKRIHEALGGIHNQVVQQLGDISDMKKVRKTNDDNIKEVVKKGDENIINDTNNVKDVVDNCNST